MGVACLCVHKLFRCSMTDGAQQEQWRFIQTTRFALAYNNSDQIIGVFVNLLGVSVY